jgi:hypothetical protein
MVRPVIRKRMDIDSNKDVAIRQQSVRARIASIQPLWMRSNTFRNLSGSGLAVGSFTMSQLNEYGLAEIALVVSSAIFLAQIFRITGWGSKSFLLGIWGVWTIFWVVDIAKMRGDKTWSNIFVNSPKTAAIDQESIYQGGVIVGKAFGRRSPTDATIFEFVELTNASRFNPREDFEFQAVRLHFVTAQSRTGMTSSRPEDGTIWEGVIAKVVSQ